MPKRRDKWIRFSLTFPFWFWRSPLAALRAERAASGGILHFLTAARATFIDGRRLFASRAVPRGHLRARRSVAARP